MGRQTNRITDELTDGCNDRLFNKRDGGNDEWVNQPMARQVNWCNNAYRKDQQTSKLMVQWMHWWINRMIDGPTNRWNDRWTNKPLKRWMDQPTNEKTDLPTNRWNGRWIDKPTNMIFYSCFSQKTDRATTFNYDNSKRNIGSSIKSCPINLKTKCKKKWRWSCRLMKTWHTYNNNLVNLFAKNLI